jgi:hypothetical protein
MLADSLRVEKGNGKNRDEMPFFKFKIEKESFNILNSSVQVQ